MSARYRKKKTITFSLVCTVVILVGVVCIALRPAIVSAVFGVGDVVVEPVLEKKAIEQTIWQKIAAALKKAGDLAFKNALKVYLTKLSEDTAVWLASAGTGQKPLFLTDPHYFGHLSDAAAGDFLDTIGTNVFGIDVCKPETSGKEFLLASTVGSLLNPQNFCQNECQRRNKNDLGTNGNTTSSLVTIGDPDFSPPITEPLPQAEAALLQLQNLANQTVGCQTDPQDPLQCNPGALMYLCPFQGAVLDNGNGDTTYDATAVDLPTCIQEYSDVINKVKQKANQDLATCMNLCSAQKRVARCTFTQAVDTYKDLPAGEFALQASQYFDPEQNDLGQVLKLLDKADEAKQAALEAFQVAQTGTQAKTNPVTKAQQTPKNITGAAGEQLASDPSGKIFSIQTGTPVADAIGVFTNTFTKKLLERLFSRGLVPNATFVSGGTELVTNGGAQAARASFATITKPDFTTGGTSVSLSELSSCPDSNPDPNNCVIDEGFRQAIEHGLTVKEAIDQGLLDATRPFGFKAVGPGLHDDVEPDFREGFPYRSMLILRRLRIVPVGWELAAQYQRDFGTAPKSLGDMISLFTNCDASAADHSFCGLVDPNWVLVAPPTYCAVTGATAAFISNDYANDSLFADAPQVRLVGRVQSCVNEKTCLTTDANGNCSATGYCVKERPSWKFDGEQCTNYNSSCDTFTSKQNGDVTYLKNTLDFEGCSTANAGCQWYCKDKDVTTNQFICTPSTDDNHNRLYLTAQAKQCPVDAVGCTEYIRSNNSSNLMPNGGFELADSGTTIDDGLPDTIQGWEAVDGAAVQATSSAFAGKAAVEFNGGTGADAEFHPKLGDTTGVDTGFPLGGQSYTLSFEGKSSDASCTGTFGMKTDVSGQSAPYLDAQTATYSSDWQRFETTIVYDNSIAYANNNIVPFFTSSNCTVALDNVQLELGSASTLYKEYGSTNKIYLSGKRTSCLPQDVGCDLYTSATDAIPGIVTASDYCTADKIGCRAFNEVALEDNGANPDAATRTGYHCSQDQNISCNVNKSDDCTLGGHDYGPCLPTISLIPSTGSECSAADVGCEEYTNLDEVARGGEGKAYYTYIRQCEKPGTSDAQTYYSWLGSEEKGFQLKSYSLVKDTDGSPKYNSENVDAGLCTEEVFNDPTNLNWTPDCQQFYDASLHVYYKLYSKTISVSDDCHPFRNTIDSTTYNAIPSEGKTCSANAAQCREYRGPAGYNTRNIVYSTFDDGTATGWDGGTPSATSLQFGGGSLYANNGIVQTNSDLDVPTQISQGHSYLVSFWAGSGTNADTTVNAAFGGATDAFGQQPAVTKWDKTTNGPLWNFYTLGPLQLRRAPTNKDTLQFLNSDGHPFYIDNIKLIEVSDSVYLIKGSYTLCAGSENCDQYTNRENQTSYLKSFTRLCPEQSIGCEALINTRNSDSPFSATYDNGTGLQGTGPKTVENDAVEWFINSSLDYCKVEYQGCTELGKPSLAGPGKYCSNDPTKKCTVGTDCGDGTCLDGSSTISKYDTVYYVDDPDAYQTSLCTAQDVGCDAWTSSTTDQTYYFHNPVPQTCEYRTVQVGGRSFPGWYKSGTSGLLSSDVCTTTGPGPYGTCHDHASQQCQQDSDCGTSGLCDFANNLKPLQPYTQPAGLCDDQTTKCRIDADCANLPGSGQCTHWAGICDSTQAGCREYRDEGEPIGCYANCLLTVDQNTGQNIPVTPTCQIDTNATCSTNQSQRCSSDSECPDGGTCGKTGCRPYWNLQQSVTQHAQECNNTVNDDLGCKAFTSPDVQ